MSMKIQSRGKMMKLLIMLLVFVIEIAAATSSSRNNLAAQNLEVQTQLKRLNKPAVKSIKSPDGDIIDCIKLTQQPAFEHPLFKDHKIQMSPNFHPERSFAANKVSSTSKGKTGSSSEVTQMWHLNGRCPKGTVPMRRTKKDDLLRASTIKAFGKKKHKTIPQPRSADPDFITQSGHQS